MINHEEYYIKALARSRMPNAREAQLMQLLADQVDDYYDLKEVTAILHDALENTIDCLPADIAGVIARILEKSEILYPGLSSKGELCHAKSAAKAKKMAAALNINVKH